MLTLEDLSCGYSDAAGAVIQPVSLALEPGAFVCVIGRNGAGKSTLMRTVCGLQPALSGHASLNGNVIAEMNAAERARSIAVVTTERVSSPGLLGRDVVELGRQPYTDWSGRLRSADQLAIEEALSAVQASPFAQKMFEGLSDGERQRVMIARALAQDSDVMVLDEITAFLDLPGRVEVMALLHRHARDNGKIVLLSSHDLELSLELAGELWLVHDGNLSRGAPRDLIEDGTIAQAFDSADVAFNSDHRRFALR